MGDFRRHEKREEDVSRCDFWKCRCGCDSSGRVLMAIPVATVAVDSYATMWGRCMRWSDAAWNAGIYAIHDSQHQRCLGLASEELESATGELGFCVFPEPIIVVNRHWQRRSVLEHAAQAWELVRRAGHQVLAASSMELIEIANGRRTSACKPASKLFVEMQRAFPPGFFSRNSRS